MRIIFAGTPMFSVAPLMALMADHQVIAVFTQPDRKSGRGKKLTAPPIKELAIANGIPVFQPTSLKDQAELIRELNANVMVVVAYGMLLPQSILDIPPLGCLNIHASILPRWRGAAPIQRAIEAGDKETGVSIMQMALGLDTGPVYHILKTPIKNRDTSASLHDKLSSLGAQGIVKTLQTLEDKITEKPTPQDDSQANYAKKISKAEANIDWQQTATEIDCKVRAFNPWPICQTFHQTPNLDQPKHRVRVWQSRPITLTHQKQPGQVLNINDSGITIACGIDALHITLLQRDGGKPLSSTQFLNGYTINIGDLLSADKLTHD